MQIAHSTLGPFFLNYSWAMHLMDNLVALTNGTADCSNRTWNCSCTNCRDWNRECWCRTNEKLVASIVQMHA